MRPALKRVLERTAVLTGVSRLARMVHRDRALVLMYHNVVPDGGRVGGDRSLHLPRGEFARQLDLLQALCEIVPLATLVERGLDTGDRCRIAITFDDAYVGAVSLGVEELRRRGIPATIFVPPGLLGQETWWDLLGAASADGLNEGVRSRMLRDYRGQTSAIRESPWWSAVHGAPPPSPEQRITDERGLALAAAEVGINIGSHTWSHPNLAVIDDETLAAELGRSLGWLRERWSS